jgi:Ca2+/H+ antiporter
MPAAAALAAAAVVAVMLPTLISSTAAEDSDGDLSAEVALSRFESVLMLLCYALFLVFQLVTHRWGPADCLIGPVFASQLS